MVIAVDVVVLFGCFGGDREVRWRTRGLGSCWRGYFNSVVEKIQSWNDGRTKAGSSIGLVN